MHFPVIDTNSDIAGVRTSERPLFHTIHQSFDNSRNKPSVDSTSNNTVTNHQFSSPFKIYRLGIAYIHTEFLVVEFVSVGCWHSVIIGLYDEMYFSKLSGSTRLFFVTIIRPRRFSNCFPIGYARLYEFNGKFIVILNTPF